MGQSEHLLEIRTFVFNLSSRGKLTLDSLVRSCSSLPYPVSKSALWSVLQALRKGLSVFHLHDPGSLQASEAPDSEEFGSLAKIELRHGSA